MAITKVQRAFTAGEISPKYHNRTDLSKYDQGVALAKNFFVDYRGGLTSRPGFRFVGPATSGTPANQSSDARAKLVRFRAATNDYLLIFSNNVIRVVSQGTYIADFNGKTVTAVTRANPAVISATAHGFTTGTWFHLDSDVGGMTELNGRIYEIGATTANTLEVLDSNGNNVDSSAFTAYTSGGEIRQLVEITTTYTFAQLTELRTFQWQGDLWLTHPDHPPRRLTFTDQYTWTLTTEAFGNTGEAPANLSTSGVSAGTAGAAFAVTAVGQDGTESLPSEYFLEELTVNYSATAGSVMLEWDTVAGAVEYYVYRSLILPVGSEVSRAQEVGYIGRAFGLQLTDNNIIPDFTKTPPINYDPFADSTVRYIEMTNQGSSYAKDDTVTVSGGGGSGFVGYPVVNNAGNILGVVIVNGGSGYSSATVAFGTSTGSSATATATLGESSGNNPAIVTRFQQRQVYAGTVNYPMSLWGARPGQPTNFDTSSVVNAGDGYEFTIDSADVVPIQHLIPIKSGLLVMSQSSIEQLRAPNGGAVSAINALADPQAYRGVSSVVPVKINSNVLFVQPYSSALFEMAYTHYSDSFDMRDISVLSNHLLGGETSITKLTYAEEPNKVIHALRSDGRWLSLTYAPDQEVFGWSQHWTNGRVTDMLAIAEADRNVTYASVERWINGEWYNYLEYLDKREFTYIEDYKGLDCSLATVPRSLAVNLTLTAGTGTGVTLTAIGVVGSFFTAADVGRIIYLAGGRATVTANTSTTLTLTFTRDCTPMRPEGSASDPIQINTKDSAVVAELYELVTNVTNLWHLEGEAVTVFADGAVITGETVVNGMLDGGLETPAGKILIGKAYTCQVKTLPINSNQIQIEGEIKNVYEVAVSLHESKGLSVGNDFDNLIPMKVREDTDWDASSGARNDTVPVSVNNTWDHDGVVCIEQSNPLPATILGLMPKGEVEG